jgi:hypothetical protein
VKKEVIGCNRYVHWVFIPAGPELAAFDAYRISRQRHASAPLKRGEHTLRPINGEDGVPSGSERDGKAPSPSADIQEFLRNKPDLIKVIFKGAAHIGVASPEVIEIGVIKIR